MTRPYKIALYSSAAISLFAAILHLSWHWTLTDLPVFQGMSAVQSQTLLLMNAAITLLLVYLTAHALLVAWSASMTLSTLRAFTLLLMAFWLGRFLLELAMPVQFPLLSENEPRMLPKVIMTLPIVVLCIPLSMEIGRRKAESATRTE